MTILYLLAVFVEAIFVCAFWIMVALFYLLAYAVKYSVIAILVLVALWREHRANRAVA